jgi:hypothetical protein
MRSIDVTKLDRKSGAQPTCPGVPWRDLQFHFTPRRCGRNDTKIAMDTRPRGTAAKRAQPVQSLCENAAD